MASKTAETSMLSAWQAAPAEAATPSNLEINVLASTRGKEILSVLGRRFSG